MAIHIRVVTPIATQGFRSPEDATKLESDGVKVDFVNIQTGPASIECNYEIVAAGHDRPRHRGGTRGPCSRSPRRRGSMSR
jgi:hypothetical protein